MKSDEAERAVEVAATGKGGRAMRYCTACGTALVEEARFCTGCGAQAPSVPPPLVPSPAETVTDPAPAPADAARDGGASERAGGGRAWVVFAVIALLAFLGAGAVLLGPYVLGGGGADDTASETVSQPEQAIAEPTATAEPSPPPAEPTPSPYEGMPISTPKPGEPDRVALRDAARALTGSTDQFLVWQLYVQGDSAVGDIQEYKGSDAVSGRRWLVTWTRESGGWRGRTFRPYLDAGRAEVKRDDSDMSDGILARVAFVVPVELPPRARDAARAARDSVTGAYEVWMPTRVPEGFSLGSESVNESTYWFEWWSGSDVLHVYGGWGDHELGGAPDVVDTRANWGGAPGWHSVSAEYGVAAVFGGYQSMNIVEGDMPEHLLRAVAMSMVKVEP